MKVIVWKVGDWKPGKFPSNGQTYDVQRIAFKAVDETDKKTYYLNLDKKQPTVVANWSPYMKEGNVLDVTISPKGSPYVNNDTTINKFEKFIVVKNISESTN